jgi:glutaredoxin
MARVTLYTRAGCHLCDDAKAEIDAARRRAAFDLEIVDVDGSEALKTAYGLEVPVVAIDGRKAFKYRLTSEELLKRLRART